MYFLRGSLPWQGLKANNKKQKYEKILEKKVSVSTEALCRGYPGTFFLKLIEITLKSDCYGVSAEFRLYFEHVKALGFEDRPDYDYLKRLFRELFFKKGFSYDNVYDWDLIGTPAAAVNVAARDTNIIESHPLPPPPVIEDEDPMLHEDTTQTGRIAGIDMPSVVDAEAQRTYQTAPMHNGKDSH